MSTSSARGIQPLCTKDLAGSAESSPVPEYRVIRTGLYADIRALQRAVGNRALGTLIRSIRARRQSEVGSRPSRVHSTSSSGGEPLDPATLQFMESRLGADFRDVRIHTDPQAAEAAQALGAKAYTMGSHITFGPTRYSPTTQEGRRLLAHELAHVLQQVRRGGDVPTQDGIGPLEQAPSKAADSYVKVVGVSRLRGQAMGNRLC